MEPTKPVQPTKIFDSVTERVRDGFVNFVSKLGVSARGEPGVKNVNSHGFYEFNLITRNRIQLEAAYRGSWIAGRVCDAVANDMVREGIQITTNEDPDLPKEIQKELKRLKVMDATRSTIKWSRLYGGAIGVLQIEGQDLESPLDPETIGEDQFKGIVVYDRWQIYPALDKLINEGPDLGLPEYYDIVLGANLNDPGQEPGGQETENANGHVRVHHTRCLRMIGIELPFWQAITEMLWGESVLERPWDKLIEFDTATASMGGLVNRAYLRRIAVDKFREIVAAGGKGQENMVRSFELMRELQVNEGLTIMDKNDDYSADTYTFAGLSDVTLQFAQQLSGSVEIPLIILFNQTPTGLNSTGETDIRIYYDSIKSKQEEKLRPFFEVLLKVICRSLTGKPAPKDLMFTFTPLWQMSATDKATVAKTTTDTVIEAHEAGLVSSSTAMKELKQNSPETGLFTHISDEDVEEAESMEENPPEPDKIIGAQRVGNPGGDPGDPATTKKDLAVPLPKPAKGKIEDTFEEGKHHRAKNGEFGSGGSTTKNEKENPEGGIESKGYKIKWVKEKTESGKQLVHANISNKGSEAGRITFFKNKKDRWEPISSIKPEHQRKGIASEVYTQFEKEQGEKLQPNEEHMSEKAKSFWKKRGKDSSEEETQLTGITKDNAWKKIRRWLSRDNAKRVAAVNDPGVAGTMKEFYKGTLKSSSGKKVTNKKQAAAIGYSEERQGKDGKKMMGSDAKKIRDWLDKQKSKDESLGTAIGYPGSPPPTPIITR